MSVFVSRRPSWRRALGLGARWGVGHSLTVVLLGAALVLTGLRLPERLGPVAERLVGVMLVGLGALAVARALRLHGHWHEHGDTGHWHLHTHHARESHDHDHRALVGIGMLHGLAGTGTLVVAIPAATAASPGHSLVFLAAFGLGTVAAMALFGAAAGYALTAAARGSLALHRGAMSLAGAASVGVGVYWLLAGGG